MKPKDISCQSYQASYKGTVIFWRVIYNLFKAVKIVLEHRKCFNICTCGVAKHMCHRCDWNCIFVRKTSSANFTCLQQGRAAGQKLNAKLSGPQNVRLKLSKQLSAAYFSRLFLSNRRDNESPPAISCFVVIGLPSEAVNSVQSTYTRAVFLCCGNQCLARSGKIMSEKFFITEWQSYFVSAISGIVTIVPPALCKVYFWWFDRDKEKRWVYRKRSVLIHLIAIGGERCHVLLVWWVENWSPQTLQREKKQ